MIVMVILIIMVMVCKYVNVKIYYIYVLESSFTFELVNLRKLVLLTQSYIGKNIKTAK